MMAQPVAILRTGLVTPVGLDTDASCAAFRCKLTNPVATQFFDDAGERLTGHRVPLDASWRGIARLAKMAALAIDEALSGIPKAQWAHLPLILCVAETGRPGRLAGLDDALMGRIENELGARFSPRSAVVAQGRCGVALALAHAREALAGHAEPLVLVAAVDSLLHWPALDVYLRRDRLLTPANSNGFAPGEAAGALLVGPAAGRADELVCRSIGLGREAATIHDDAPLRGDGLTQAVSAALSGCGARMHDMDFRVTDLSGEQYYFKEAALALTRTLRVREEEFELWHPAECTGEVGAAAGTTVIAAAKAACEKQYAPGPDILAHWSDDDGPRAALCLRHGGMP